MRSFFWRVYHRCSSKGPRDMSGLASVICLVSEAGFEPALLSHRSKWCSPTLPLGHPGHIVYDFDLDMSSASCWDAYSNEKRGCPRRIRTADPVICGWALYHCSTSADIHIVFRGLSSDCGRFSIVFRLWQQILSGPECSEHISWEEVNNWLQ